MGRVRVREADGAGPSSRQAVLAGISLGIGGDLIAHAMAVSHVEGILAALMAYGLAIAIDTIWSAKG